MQKPSGPPKPQGTPAGPEKLLTPGEVAGMLGFSRVGLKKLRRQGNGPRYIVIGRSIRYRRSEIDRFLTEREQSSTQG